MARLKLSPSGLRGPLDLPETSEAASVVTITRKPTAVPEAPAATVDAPVATAAVPAATTDAPAGPNVAAEAEATVEAAPVEEATPRPADAPATAPVLDPLLTAVPTGAAPADAVPAAATVSPVGDDVPATATSAGGPEGDLPAWAAALDPAVLRPERLLGRPKQTALILDRDLSARADALVAGSGPRVTFAAIVTAVLHFHLPADGEAAARRIGGYRRRRLEALEHPWEERNARLPEPLRAELDDVVAGATGRVASVRRSTLVNALLDAHLPADAGDAARLVTRMEMVRGGAFLD